jgi:FkbM family methyltransferase
MSSETLSLTEKLHYYHRFWRYWSRTEPDTVRFIKEEFAPGGLALDIGANKGIVTYFLGRQAGPKGRVLAFEPQPEMRQQISRVARSFGLNNVEAISVALSNHNETATLFRGNPGATANLIRGGKWQTDTVEVETITLDSFFEERQLIHLDFLKCDVDGFELEVLQGAEATLKRFHPKVLIEIGETNLPEVADTLKSFGYDGGVFWYQGKRYPCSQTQEVGYRHPNSKWRNFLFRKKG